MALDNIFRRWHRCEVAFWNADNQLRPVHNLLEWQRKPIGNNDRYCASAYSFHKGWRPTCITSRNENKIRALKRLRTWLLLLLVLAFWECRRCTRFPTALFLCCTWLGIGFQIGIWRNICGNRKITTIFGNPLNIQKIILILTLFHYLDILLKRSQVISIIWFSMAIVLIFGQW